MRAFVLALLLAVPALVSAQSLGSIDFPTSAENPEAQAVFERGLLLLHSFEYDDARDAFQEARQLEPFDFPMAAWGEAMTHNRPIWQQQDLQEGMEALASLGDYPNGVDDMEISDRERGYLHAAFGMFFETDVDKNTRDDAFELAMAELAAAYPDDLDAQSLWALSILGTAHEGRDFATYMRAAAILEEVFARNPEHPGAAHYLIHAYDDAVHAPLGLRPARVYDKIAPDASHALHMPSHIYLSLGMWDKTAELNRRSFEAAKANSDRRGEALNNHGWHALWWWHYAETQRNDPVAARSLYQRAVDLAGSKPDRTAAAHVTRIRAQHVAATGETDILDAVPRADASIYDLYATALASIRRGDIGGARAAYDALKARNEAESSLGWSAQSAEIQLRAWILHADGDSEAALAAAHQAASIENEAPLTFGPPSPVIPANEVLGTLLLDLDRPEEAASAFQAALARAPGRRQSVEGLAAVERLTAAR